MASEPAPSTRGPGRCTQGVTKVRGAARPVQEGGQAHPHLLLSGKKPEEQRLCQEIIKGT